MKKLTYLSLIIAFTISSCQQKNGEDNVESESAEQAEWKEMDEFHMIMAESFHPYRDSANVAPAKDYASEMASLADTWMQAKLPGKVSNDEVKSALEKLSQQCEDFKLMVDSGTDEEIGQALTAIHDTFHGLQESWYRNKNSAHQ
ncbi:MAG: hypothetical protein RLN86_12740 [Cyclobacteriaceae bacterium]